MSNNWREVIDLQSVTEERNPATMDIDLLKTQEIVDLIIAEDSAVSTAIEKVSRPLAKLVDAAVTSLQAGGRVHYVGAGTSGRLGVLDAVELLPTFGVGTECFVAHMAGGTPAMMKAVEGAEDDVALGASEVAEVGEHDLVVGLSASGRTPYVRGALEEARKNGATTAVVSSNVHASLAEYADIAILVDTGPEVLTGSTRLKAGTAEKMILNNFSTTTMIKLGKTYSNLMIEVLPTNVKLDARTVRMLAQATGIDIDTCRSRLKEANYSVNAALVSLLADVPVERAKDLLSQGRTVREAIQLA